MLAPEYYIVFFLLLLIGMVVFSSRERIMNDAFPLLFLPVAFYSIGFIASPLAEYWIRKSTDFPSVRHAVGLASYLGYSKSAESRIFMILFLVYVIGSLAFLLVASSKTQNGIVHEKKSSQSASKQSHSVLFLLSVVILFCLYALANMIESHQVEVNHAFEGVFALDIIDNMNHYCWKYCYLQGWLPYRDFWYPYSGMFYVRNCNIVHYAYLVSLGLGFIFSIYYLLEKSKVWTSLGIVFIWVGLPAIFDVLVNVLPGETFGWNRLPLNATMWQKFFPALICIFLFLALRRMEKPKWGYYLFGVVLAYFFIIDSINLIYAAPPLLVLIVLHCFKARSEEERKALLKNLAATTGILAILIAFYFGFLEMRGQLSGFVTFYLRDIQDIATYASIPTKIANWYTIGSSHEHILFLLLHVFVSFGLYKTIRELKTPCTSSYGDMILAIGILGLLAIQKQLLRPHMALQALPIYFIGIFMFLGSVTLRLGPWGKRTIATALILLMLIPLCREESRGMLRQLVTAPKTICRHLESGLKSGTGDKKPDEDFFSASRFEPTDREVLEYWEAYSEQHPDSSFFVFPDNAHLYIITKQKPPYYISTWDTAPLAAQREILKWLQEAKPALVFWEYENHSYEFDSVPHTVRIPLIYEYIRRNYAPFHKISKYEVLVPKRSDYTTSIKYWKERLGSTIDVGALPAISSFDNPDCALPGNGGVPAEFLYVRIAEPVSGMKCSVTLAADGHVFRVFFREMRGVKDYYINLSRIWFWNAMKENRSSEEIGVSGNGNFKKIEVVKKNFRALY